MTVGDDIEQHLSAETVAALRAMTEHDDGSDVPDAVLYDDGPAPEEPAGAFLPLDGELIRVGSGPASTTNDTKPQNPAAPVIIRPTQFTWSEPSQIPPRRWLYGRRLIRKYVSATIAAPGVGKSTLGLAEDVAMTTGRDLLGYPVIEPLRVWSWNGEDPRDELERRIAAICVHYGVQPEEMSDRLFIDSGREQAIIIAHMTRAGVAIATPVIDAVTAAIKANRIDVMRIDPFVSSHRVSENDNVAIDAVAKAWAQIADRTGCAIELVHHSRKTGGGCVTVEDARGASALLGAVRSARVLNVMSEDEATRAGVERRRGFVRIDDGKSNLAPSADKSEWIEIVSVGLGNGGGGPEDFVGVATRWEWPNAFDGLSTADLRKVQDTIAASEWAENVQATNWAGHAVAQTLGLDVSNPGDKARIKTLLRTWIANGVLRVVRRRNDRQARDQSYIVVGAPA